MSETRLFPIQPERGARPHPIRIPWAVAELAYSVYSAQYGRDQSLDTLARRGGFGPGEMDVFLPDWRERCYENARLRSDLATVTESRDRLQAFKDWVHNYLDTHGIPHHPPGTHGAAGCRIGDRMDWLMASLAAVTADRDRLLVLIGESGFLQMKEQAVTDCDFDRAAALRDAKNNVAAARKRLTTTTAPMKTDASDTIVLGEQ